MIEGKIEYNGKVMVYSTDRDGSMWVNDEKTRFEDGSPVSIEDIVEMLTFYGHDLLKRRSKHQNIHYVRFWDDDDNYILFKDNGDPVIRIVDGRICSAAHDCICDKTFPMRGGAYLTRGAYDGFKTKVENSGIFHKGKKRKKLYGYNMIYCCKTCGNEWVLSSPDSMNMCTWLVKRRMELRA